MAAPVPLEAASWIAFACALVLTFLFSTWYVLSYIYKRHSECSSTLTAIVALSVSLLTVIMGPVDVFLVSFMKTDEGDFKEWAESNTTRHNIQETVLYCYYALYGCLTLFVFLIIPFVYFYYEEQEENITTKARMCGALKYTSCFVFVAAILLMIGAFVPLKKPPVGNSTYFDELSFLANELHDTRGETALYFTIGSLTLIGFITLVFYTGYGMIALPADLIKGQRSSAVELDDVRTASESSRSEQRVIRRKYKDQGRRINSRDRSRINSLHDEEELLKRKERHLEAMQSRCFSKCTFLWRPFQITIGVVCSLTALLIFVSLLLTSIDRALHSLGVKTGYILPKRGLPNPIDIVLLESQQVFPLDYILFASIVLYLFFATMAGIERIGIWFCCVKMYKIRSMRTKPQALLFLCMVLIFTVLAINTMMYTLAPEYMTYGNQKYKSSENNSTVQCTTAVPDDCVMSVAASLLTTFVFKLWFFGACYYWANWAFLAVFLIGLVVSLIKRQRSSIQGEVDSDDTDDSDDELIGV